MTRACDLGPGDVWGNPPDDVDRCECGREFDFDCEPCAHGNCYECRDASECCLECSACHRYVEADEFDTEEMAAAECIDCQVAAQERAEALIESDLARLEDIGRERYYEAKYGDAL